MMAQDGQTALVIIHAKIIEVTLEASLERLMLHPYWQMPPTAAQLMGGMYRPPQSSLPRFPRHVPPTPLAIPAPVHRESQEIEGSRTFSTFLVQLWSLKFD